MEKIRRKSHRTNPVVRGARPNLSRKGKHHRVDKVKGLQGRGRPLGAKNYWTRDWREAIRNAAITHGYDGKGTGGVEGYMLMVASTDVKTFAMLIRATMPTEMTVEHKEAPPENEAELRRYIERLGLPATLLDQSSVIKYHTPAEVLELTAADVTEKEDGDDK